MNKSELVTAVVAGSTLTRAQSEEAINAMFEAMAEALTREEKIQILGFGTFEVKHRSERKGRNPQTGEEMIIPPSKSPTFKAGKPLKDRVSGKFE